MKYQWVCHLKKLIEEKGVTQRELSAETGISTSTITRLNNNFFNRIDLPTLIKLAEYFDIQSGDELFECVIIQEDGK